MTLSSLNKNTNLIFLSILFSISSVLLSNYLLAAISLLVIIFLTIIEGEKIFLFLTITSFLTLTSTISTELRTVVQIFNFLILFFIFIKHYGLVFSKYPRIPKQVQILIILLYSSMIFSTAFSDHVMLGIVQIARLSLFFILVYMIYSLLENGKILRMILIAFFVTGCIYSITIFKELADNNFDFIQMNINQIEKIDNNYINMNLMGGFLFIVISIGLAYLLSQIERRKKRLILFLTLIFLAGLIIANSRAAILALILSTMFILYHLNRKIFKSLIIAGLVCIPFYFIPQVQDFIGIYFRTENLSTGRNFILETIYNVILQNPVIGYGPAATKYAIYPNLPFMLGSPAEKFMQFHYNQIQFGHAHNFYLFLWSDLGLPGLLTSIFLPVIYFKLCARALRKLREAGNHEYYNLVIALTGAGIGLFIRGLFEWGGLISYGTIGSDLPFWIIFSIIIYVNNKEFSTGEKIFLLTGKMN